MEEKVYKDICEKEFNLLDEPWIKVIDSSLMQKEVTLKEVIINSHKYKRLAGEMPTQDVAVFRILLAIVLTIFYRYDENGEEDEISEDNYSDENTVIERWEKYYKDGKFNEQIASVIDTYLEKYRERFYLFHPKTPFWQVIDFDGEVTSYGISSLLGNVKASNNYKTKANFSMREISEDDKSKLSYSEAARWLVHLNGYAVNIKHPKGTGVGRLGQIGFIMVDGENLFKKLMLNLCPLWSDEIWNSPKPIWEKDVINVSGNISRPDNLPELYTLMSRFIKIKRDEKKRIKGIDVRGGNFYSTKDDPVEAMSLWRKIAKKNEPIYYIPKTYNANTKLWREFSSIFPEIEKDRIPIVKQWQEILLKNELLDKFITFKIIGMEYGDAMNYLYGDCIYDEVTFSSQLLDKFEEDDNWIVCINNQIDICQNKIIKALKGFATDIKNLYGCASIGKNLINQYFFLIDTPFREWLKSIDPKAENQDNYKNEKEKEWQKTSLFYARKVVYDYISSHNINVYFNKQDKNTTLSMPKILNKYMRIIYSAYK